MRSGVVAAAPGSTPRARFGDGFSAAAMAAPSSPPPPAPSRRIPAAYVRRLQPGRGQSRRVLRPRGKLLWLRGGFLRAQRVFVSGHTSKEGSAPSLTARTHPTFQTPEGETSGRDPAVCPPPPPAAPRGALGLGWMKYWKDEPSRHPPPSFLLSSPSSERKSFGIDLSLKLGESETSTKAGPAGLRAASASVRDLVSFISKLLFLCSRFLLHRLKRPVLFALSKQALPPLFPPFS